MFYHLKTLVKLNFYKSLAIDCMELPDSVLGKGKGPSGCRGATNENGEHNKNKCRRGWYKKCCRWKDQTCVTHLPALIVSFLPSILTFFSFSIFFTTYKHVTHNILLFYRKILEEDLQSCKRCLVDEVQKVRLEQ